jgi:DNA (cytosine-5)-methyltransferase 1
MSTSATSIASLRSAAPRLRDAEPQAVERYAVHDGRLLRHVARRDGEYAITDLGAARWQLTDPHAEADRRLLRRRTAPDWQSTEVSAIRIIDLFSGCGALSLGALEAARALGLPARIELAVDLERAPLSVLAASMGAAGAIRQHDLAAVLDGRLGQAETPSERMMLRGVRSGPEVCVAGPPCQGHSTLNNHTRHDDERNDLYLRTVRFAELREPRLLLVENVASILNDQRRSLERAVEHLGRLGYHVDQGSVALNELGVPQTRRRHLLLASAAGEVPMTVQGLVDAYRVPDPSRRDLRWAIGDLLDISGDRPIDQPTEATEINRRRMQLLIEEDLDDLPDEHRPPCHRDQNHTYKSMYGRLRWHLPAQTVTSGFGSMGQGRYVHPALPRTLTAHEAARLQLVPDFVRLDQAPGRQQRARIIGNVAPLKLSYCAALELLR